MITPNQPLSEIFTATYVADSIAPKPDVILMDLMKPGMDGIAATRRIHREHPNVKIIALTCFSERNLVQGALKAGAIGYLQKNITAVELKKAIHAAHAGRMTLSPEAMQAMA